MGGPGITHGKEKKWKQNFRRKTEKEGIKELPLGDVGVSGRMKLGWILKEYDLDWTQLSQVRIQWLLPVPL
jgi:hypothetical protein